MAFRDRLFDEEDTEKLRFLSNGCGIQCIWGIHVGNWVGLPDEASCRQACSRSGMAQAPVVLGRGGVAWLLLATHVLMVCPCMSAGPVQHEASQFSECP